MSAATATVTADATASAANKNGSSTLKIGSLEAVAVPWFKDPAQINMNIHNQGKYYWHLYLLNANGLVISVILSWLCSTGWYIPLSASHTSLLKIYWNTSINQLKQFLEEEKEFRFEPVNELNKV